MNNLYHKFAVACVCTTLGFTLGANKEGKAATFTLIPTYPSVFIAVDFGGFDGLGDAYYPTNTPSVAIRPDIEIRAFYEFNIGNLSVGTNTIIRQAIVETRINSSNTTNFPNFLSIFGYVGNGIADISDFEAGVFLNSVDISSSSANDILRFDVTPFVNQLVSNNDNFAGFGIRASNFGGVGLNATNNNSSLVVETDDVAEPVPEPTTIFGLALALGVGGWLKRKKSSQQNKTRSQH